MKKHCVSLHYQQAARLSLRPNIEPKQTAPNRRWVIFKRLPSSNICFKPSPNKSHQKLQSRWGIYGISKFCFSSLFLYLKIKAVWNCQPSAKKAALQSQLQVLLDRTFYINHIRLCRDIGPLLCHYRTTLHSLSLGAARFRQQVAAVFRTFTLSGGTAHGGNLRQDYTGKTCGIFY